LSVNKALLYLLTKGLALLIKSKLFF